MGFSLVSVLNRCLIDIERGLQASSTGPTAKHGALFRNEKELIPMVSTFISLSEIEAID